MSEQQDRDKSRRQAHQVNHVANDSSGTCTERHKFVGNPERNASTLARPELGQLSISDCLTLVERGRRHVEWLPYSLLHELHVRHTGVRRHDV